MPKIRHRFFGPYYIRPNKNLVPSTKDNRRMKVQIYLSALYLAFASSNVYAVDATSSATKILTFDKWKIIEFAAQRQIFYRVSSDSTNFPDQHIVFDFVPSNKCLPTPALMIVRRDSYNPDLDDGRVILAYKLPGQPEVSELTRTVMQRGDTFAFFQFTELSAAKLAAPKSEGSLAIWVPPSFDGVVKRSSNIYFSLDGSRGAINKAKALCNANR
jgi:hypothetical protein